MKHQVDNGRTYREFKIGDFVYVKLQPYRHKLVANRKCLELATKYFRPYKKLDRIRDVVYQLKLPLGAKVHQMFHVSQLKKHLGREPAQRQLFIMDNAGLIIKDH